MLDLKFVKEHLDEVKANIKNRNMEADADLVVKLYDERTALTTRLQSLQQKRNENAANMKQKLDPETRQKFIDEGKRIKEEVALAEKELSETEARLDEAARQLPNMCHPDTPIGKLDTENLEVKKSGTPRKFTFKPKSHVELGEELDLIDFERGTKVSGPKFYYLKNEAVFLEEALIMYALNVLRKHGFTTFIGKRIEQNVISDSSTPASEEKREYKKMWLNEEIDLTTADLNRCVQAFLCITPEEMQAHEEYFKQVFKDIFETLFENANSTVATLIRKAICRLDEVLYL